MPSRRTLLAAVSAVVLLAAATADAGRGFVSSRPLHRTDASSGTEARGGFAAWFRMRHDRTFVQGLRVWFDGVEDADGATLWMSKPGDAELAEVGTFATTVHEDGLTYSGMFEVVVDSERDDGAEIPAGAESMLRLLGAPVEVRIPAGIADAEDITVLEGEVGSYRFRRLKVDAAGLPGRRARLRRPVAPDFPPDESAVGTASLWRRRLPGKPPVYAKGIVVFARGLEPDADYEVLIEDPAGDMVETGEFTASADGLALFSIDSREGDTFPDDLEAEDVRDLRRRRVEIVRSGFSTYSLAGLFR